MADGLRGGLLGEKEEGASALTDGAAGDESGVEIASGFKVEVGEEEDWLWRGKSVTADFSGKGAVSAAGSCRVGAAVLSGACSMPFVTGDAVTAAGEMLVQFAAQLGENTMQQHKTGSWCSCKKNSTASSQFPAGKYSLFA